MMKSVKIALKIAIILFAKLLSPTLVAQTIGNTEQLTQNYLQIRFLCEPCISSSPRIYEYIGFNGSGEIGEIKFENGKFVSFSHRSRTESNGMYHYIETSHFTDAFYSDTVARIMCSWSTYGNGREPLRNGTDVSVKYQINNGKAFCDKFEIEYVNDSTVIEKFSDTYSRTFIISPNHILVKSSSEENDMWNIEMWIENGNPIRIKDYRGERCYRYTEFDDKGNWIKRERINNEGSIALTETRIINY